jgi:hypothetical protein
VSTEIPPPLTSKRVRCPHRRRLASGRHFAATNYAALRPDERRRDRSVLTATSLRLHRVGGHAVHLSVRSLHVPDPATCAWPPSLPVGSSVARSPRWSGNVATASGSLCLRRGGSSLTHPTGQNPSNYSWTQRSLTAAVVRPSMANIVMPWLRLLLILSDTSAACLVRGQHAALVLVHACSGSRK